MYTMLSVVAVNKHRSSSLKFFLAEIVAVCLYTLIIDKVEQIVFKLTKVSNLKRKLKFSQNFCGYKFNNG